jgi:hypothetical protein
VAVLIARDTASARVASDARKYETRSLHARYLMRGRRRESRKAGLNMNTLRNRNVSLLSSITTAVWRIDSNINGSIDHEPAEWIKAHVAPDGKREKRK